MLTTYHEVYHYNMLGQLAARIKMKNKVKSKLESRVCVSGVCYCTVISVMCYHDVDSMYVTMLPVCMVLYTVTMQCVLFYR